MCDLCSQHRLTVDAGDDDAERYYQLGRACKTMKDVCAAVANFKRAIAIDPDHVLAHSDLGASLLDLAGRDTEKLKASKFEFETAIRLNPRDVWAHLFLANVFGRLEQISREGECLEAAAEISPHVSIAHRFYGEFLTFNTKKIKLAKYHLKKAYRLDSRDANAALALGGCLMNWHQWSDAEFYLKRAIELGSSQAHGLLRALATRRPKTDRWQICAECGTSRQASSKWWCGECGADLRIKVYQNRNEYRAPSVTKPIQLVLPR